MYEIYVGRPGRPAFGLLYGVDDKTALNGVDSAHSINVSALNLVLVIALSSGIFTLVRKMKHSQDASAPRSCFVLRLSSLGCRVVDLKEGILDPSPLLRTEETPSKGRKGKARLVNPLLLVTERKGTESSLHYGSFPLDAFNTDGKCTHPLEVDRIFCALLVCGRKRVAQTAIGQLLGTLQIQYVFHF